MKPPTSIVNLIFIMSNQTTVNTIPHFMIRYVGLIIGVDFYCQLLARTHFDPPLDFLDLFMPTTIPSPHRARAFLWLVYHYLEDPTSSSCGSPSTNPFADEYSRANPGKVPLLPRLSQEAMRELHENLDPPDEIEWGSKMCALRTAFLKKLVKTTEVERKNRSEFSTAQGSCVFFSTWI